MIHVGSSRNEVSSQRMSIATGVSALWETGSSAAELLCSSVGFGHHPTRIDQNHQKACPKPEETRKYHVPLGRCCQCSLFPSVDL